MMKVISSCLDVGPSSSLLDIMTTELCILKYCHQENCGERYYCFIFQLLAVKILEVSQSYLEFIVFKSHGVSFNLKLYLTGLEKKKKKKSLQNSMC